MSAPSASTRKQDDLPQKAVERLKKIFAKSELAAFLGVEVALIERDHVVMKMACQPQVMNANGTINGGAMATLLDNATAAAAWTTPEAKETTRGTTVALHVNFIGVPKQGGAVADARVISRGGTLVVVDVICHDEGGNLLAKGQATYKLDLARDRRLAQSAT